MKSAHKIHLLYFGRLDDEKGFGSIIHMLEYFLQKHHSLPFVLTVFGSGKYEKEIKKLDHRDKNIHYYGFQSLDVIKQHAKHSQYILMPSLFLETFGLSALNALSRGIPVIGYKKGGLDSFILDGYDLGQYDGSPETQLVSMINKLMGGDLYYAEHTKQAACIAESYDFDTRFAEFQQIFGGPKKILLVTDFIEKLGGIETYIYAIAEELRMYGYTIRIIGSHGGKTIGSRLLSMVQSLCNIPFALRLRCSVQKFKPDAIRYHSVLRHIGWLPLAVVGRHTKSYVMLHDFGYMHPYPHSVYAVSDLPSSSGLWSFVCSAHSYNPCIWIAVAIKWCMIRLLWRQFARMKGILVPSTFMQDTCAVWTKNTLRILPHFIQC